MPKTKTEEMSLTTLFQNESVAQNLFSMLPAKDLMSINQVDKTLHAATNREDVWKFHWRKLVGANATEPASFKEACREIIKRLYQEERVKNAAMRSHMGKFLGSLPDETLISILSFLNRAELSKVGRVSKYLKELSEDNGLWLAFIKKKFKIEPPKNQPMKTYFKFLTNFLKIKFIEEHPQAVLTAPKEKIKPTEPLFSFGTSYLEWLCFVGNKAELEAFLLSYKHTSIEKAYDSNDKRVQKLIRCINLALDNKNCPEAFSLLMNSLSCENRAVLISLLGRNQVYLYIFLNCIKFGIPLELFRGEPILASLIKMNPKDQYLFRFIKFLVAYNINCVEQIFEGKTPFYFACECSNLELVKYFVFDVSQVTQLFFTLGESSWISFILRALKETSRTREEFSSWMDIIAHLIQLFPQLLEEKCSIGISQPRSVAELILCDYYSLLDKRSIDWSSYKDLFIAIDNYFFRNNKSTLLHYLLEKNPDHPMLDFWIKERAQTRVENKKYVDFACNDKAPLVLAYQSMCGSMYFELRSIMNVFELLLKSGANPNVFLNNEPLLWVLVKNKLFKVAKLFLEYGADPTYVDESGKSPIWKISKKYPEFHELVKESYKKLGKAFPVTKAEQALKIQALSQQIEKLMANAAKPEKAETVEKSTQTSAKDFQPTASM